MCALRPAPAAVAPLPVGSVPAAVLRDGLRHDCRFYSRSLRNVIVEHRPDAAFAALAGQPVRSVHGRADRSAPIGNVRALAERFPDWGLTVVPRGDPLPPIEQPPCGAAALGGGAAAPG